DAPAVDEEVGPAHASAGVHGEQGAAAEDDHPANGSKCPIGHALTQPQQAGTPGVGYGSDVIPIRDTVRSRSAPVVTVALIVVNVLVFLHEIALGPPLERFVYAYGLIPRRFVYWQGDPFDPLRFLPLFTSMFWRGGWLHLIGNMLYLWIFGDNVEDRLGHLRYLLFYVLAGVAAGITHVALG